MIVDPSCAYASTKGIRDELRDALVVSRHIRPELDVYAVSDGKEDRSASAHVCNRVLLEIQQTHVVFSVEGVTTLFKGIAARVLDKRVPGFCSVAFALISKGRIITAHIGNARAMILTGAGVIRCKTRPHTPRRRSEYERIHQARGIVVDGQAGGTLPLSRAIGKTDVKGVTADPEVGQWEIEGDDKYLVLATDGVTDWLTAQCIRQQATTCDDAQTLAYTLRNLAFAADSDDNITVVVVDLRKRPAE
jgi:serine/threonine protein phosphatase PrpC